MVFCDRDTVSAVLRGKHVAIVGSGPGSLGNQPGFVDSHDVVVRINNYKTGPQQGFRTDVFYSFFGGSIMKKREDLQADGVRLCICKCPDAKFMDSEWHKKVGKPHGVDFRYIYKARKDWWFCDTYLPTLGEFLEVFNLLGNHVPSTGFSAFYEVMKYEPASIYLTGFDFFASRIHDVDKPWKPGSPDDPIGHSREREWKWLSENRTGVRMDPRLIEIMDSDDPPPFVKASIAVKEILRSRRGVILRGRRR